MSAKYRLAYYETDSGRQPVAGWIDGRSASERAKVSWILARLSESGFLLGPPWLKKLDDDIWEVRVRHAGSQLRVLFYLRRRDTFVLLHAFSKKTQTTPKRMLDTARARLMQDWERAKESD